MNIGFIGLGAMGKPMALNLLKASHQVMVFDANKSAVDGIVSEGGLRASSLNDLAENSSVVFSSLPNGAIVESVMTCEKGVIDSCKSGSAIVDLSSVAPETSKKMYQAAKSNGLYYLDAPVSGGVAGAVAGTLTLMVGGDDEGFELVKPLLEIIGKNIYHVGPIGSGDAIKLVNNLLLGCNMAALSEALTLGQKCGLSLNTMYDILKISSGRSYALEAKMEPFIMADKIDGGFAINLQHKDLQLALEAANNCNMPVMMTSVAAQTFAMAKSMDYGNKDISALVKMWQKITEPSH